MSTNTEGELTILVLVLGGCFSRARTGNEALRNAQEAMCCHPAGILQHRAGIRQERDSVPLETEDVTEALVLRMGVVLEEAQATQARARRTQYPS